jgi:NAD(P)-dependent dehydrogenase (short-subunit alcohol dehydrogenase family)
MDEATLQPVAVLERAVGRFAGRAAIVTGAGSGIGLATTRKLADQGAWVLAGDVSPDHLERLAGVEGVQTLRGDVSVRADAEELVSTALARFGRLDVLVNNAGIVDAFVPAGEVTDELWERVLGVNLTGPLLTTRAALPPMLARGGGVIVNVSSVGGLFGGRAGAAYTVSKHGLVGLTRSVAATYGRDGIRCVAVCPGGVDTGIPIGGEPSERGTETLALTSAAMPPLASADEVADVVLFAASEEASFVNGTVLVADGGWTAI